MLLNPNDCCECGCCKGGLDDLTFAFTLNGFVSLPEPSGDEQSPYYRVSNAEDLNTEIVFTGEDFGDCEKALVINGCQALSESVAAATLHQETWTKTGGEGGDEWEVIHEEDFDLTAQAYVVRDGTADRWTTTFLHSIMLGTADFSESVESGPFECVGYEGELNLDDWVFDGINFAGTTLGLLIERPPA